MLSFEHHVKTYNAFNQLNPKFNAGIQQLEMISRSSTDWKTKKEKKKKKESEIQKLRNGVVICWLEQA